MNNIIDLLNVLDELYECARKLITFDSNGWPIFKKEYFLDDWPNEIIPFEHKNSKLILDKKETVICFYMGDSENYRRFLNWKRDILIYKQYKGVIFPDITLTSDMDDEFQELIMLANQLFAAMLVANGVKVIFNTRNGGEFTKKYFKNIPRNIMCASGFLGCDNAKGYMETEKYINKILGLMPNKLLIYGKHDYAVDEQLDLLGMEYRYYLDFHARSKQNSIMKRKYDKILDYKYNYFKTI